MILSKGGFRTFSKKTTLAQSQISRLLKDSAPVLSHSHLRQIAEALSPTEAAALTKLWFEEVQPPSVKFKLELVSSSEWDKFVMADKETEGAITRICSRLPHDRELKADVLNVDKKIPR